VKREDFDTVRRLIAAAAWGCLAVIAYATLSPVGVVYSVYEKLAPFIAQPSILTYVHFEHLLAYAVLGGLLYLAYPRSILLACCIVFGAAGLLELAQTLTLDRHATIGDALEKMAGAAIGIGIAKAILLFIGKANADRAGHE
jgi:VanZ family protein